MKCLFVCLSGIWLAACNPISNPDEDSTPAEKPLTSKRSATPTPVPKPGDWMEKKKSARRLEVENDPLKAKAAPLKAKANPLGVKGDRLDEKAK